MPFLREDERNEVVLFETMVAFYRSGAGCCVSFALTGCGSSTNSASFTWFVDSIPANLDPQVASGASDVIACENLYGTLVRKDPDGELVPGSAKSGRCPRTG